MSGAWHTRSTAYPELCVGVRPESRTFCPYLPSLRPIPPLLLLPRGPRGTKDPRGELLGAVQIAPQLTYHFQLSEPTVLKSCGHGQNEAALAASQAHVLGQRVSRWSFCLIIYEGEGLSSEVGKCKPLSLLFSLHVSESSQLAPYWH